MGNHFAEEKFNELRRNLEPRAENLLRDLQIGPAICHLMMIHVLDTLPRVITKDIEIEVKWSFGTGYLRNYCRCGVGYQLLHKSQIFQRATP